MLREWWQYWRAQALPWAVNHGLKSEAVGIYARYLRHQPQWQAHYQQCQQVIEQALRAHLQRWHLTQLNGDIVILGSGLGLDIPLDFLASRCQTLWLVDGVHLPVALKRYASIGNAQAVNWDVTGHWTEGGHDAFSLLQDDWPQPSLQQRFPNVQWVVSLNLLGQIGRLPIQAWARHHPALTDAQHQWVMRRFIHQHRALCHDVGGVLISDTSHQWFENGALWQRHDPLAGVNPGEDGMMQPLVRWWWTVATAGEFRSWHKRMPIRSKRLSQVNRVAAWYW